MAAGAALIIGALASLASQAMADTSQPDQINPLTDQRYQDLQNMMSQYQPQFNALSGEAQQSRQAQQGTARKSEQLGSQAETLRQASPNAWFGQYMENIEEYKNVAEEVSRLSTEQLGRDISTQQAIDMEQALRAAGDATAGQGFSGAAQAAAGQSAGQVIGQAGLARQQAATDVFNQTFQNMAGQGQQLAFQDQQMQFNNALQQLGVALQGQGQAGSLFGQAGQQAIGQQSNIANLINAIQGNIQDISQPVYSRPEVNNKYSGVGANIAAIGQGIDSAGEFNFDGMFDSGFSGLGSKYGKAGSMYDPTIGKVVN